MERPGYEVRRETLELVAEQRLVARKRGGSGNEPVIARPEADDTPHSSDLGWFAGRLQGLIGPEDRRWVVGVEIIEWIIESEAGKNRQDHTRKRHRAPLNRCWKDVVERQPG